MVTFIQTTAQYTNAALVAILPYITDFAKKLDLSLKTPITTNQVKRFLCDPRKGHVEGSIFLFNGDHFAFVDGVVSGYWDELHSWQSVNDERQIPAFAGKPIITRDEAVGLARETIRRLGYSESDFYAEADPVVGLPFQFGTNYIPFYTVRWADAQGSDCPTNESYECSARIEIDGLHKAVTSLHFSTRTIRRAQPKVAVEPRNLSPGKIPDSLTGSPIEGLLKSFAPTVQLSVSQRSNLLNEIVARILGYAHKAGLSLDRRFTIADISDLDLDGYPERVVASLRNGTLFVFTEGYITWYRGPHAFFGGYLDQPVKKYWGKWKVDQNEAIELARCALNSAGYSKEDFHYDDKPMVKRALQVGSHAIPRYQVVWTHKVQADGVLTDYSRVQVEIDASTGTIKSLGVESSNFNSPTKWTVLDTP